MKSLIEKYKESNNKLGCIENTTHRIQLNGTPTWRNLNYTVPLKFQQKRKELIQKLKEEKIIFITNSCVVPPAFLISKKNTDDLRLVIDYREVNKFTIKFPFPLPKINNYLSELTKSSKFSQIDMKSRYYQIKVNRRDRVETVFSFMNQVYAFNRMSFGLVNAPENFRGVCIISLCILISLKYI